MRLYALVEASDPEAVDVHLCSARPHVIGCNLEVMIGKPGGCVGLGCGGTPLSSLWLAEGSTHETHYQRARGGVILGSTGIAAATSHRTTGSLTYRGIRCVTARETSAIVCSKVKHGGYTASMSTDFISVWRNSDGRVVFQRRNR